MIIKKVFNAAGTQLQEVAAVLNRQVKDELLATGLFELLSEEVGNAGKPKYTLKHIHSDYKLVFQSSESTYQAYVMVELKRGELTTVTRNIDYGLVSAATMYIHIIANGSSIAFKILNHQGNFAAGGYCLRFQTFDGNVDFLYNTYNEILSFTQMGRGTTDDVSTYQVQSSAQRSLNCAFLQEKPMLVLNNVTVGYLLDAITINADFLIHDSNLFSLYNLDGVEYHGSRLAMSGHQIAPYTAIAMRS